MDQQATDAGANAAVEGVVAHALVVAVGIEGADDIAEGIVLMDDDTAVGLQLTGVIQALAGQVAVGVVHADLASQDVVQEAGERADGFAGGQHQ